MAIFTKTNNAILKEGQVPFEGNQSMGGNRIRRAGEEVDDGDYVIKKTLDDHPHDFAPITHGDELHTVQYSYNKHSHSYDWSTASNADNGYQKLPGGVILQWGLSPIYENPDNRSVSAPEYPYAIDGRTTPRDFTLTISTAPNIAFPNAILNVQANMHVGDSLPALGYDSIEQNVYVKEWDTTGVATWITFTVMRNAGFWDYSPDREDFKIQWFAIGY